jgi:hypothetical protein
MDHRRPVQRTRRASSAARMRACTQLLAVRVARRRGCRGLAFLSTCAPTWTTPCIPSVLSQGNRRPLSSKFVTTTPSRAKLSHPVSSSPSCESSAPPSSLSNPLKRQRFFFFPESGRHRRRGTLRVGTLLHSVPRLTSDCFALLLFP